MNDYYSYLFFPHIKAHLLIRSFKTNKFQVKEHNKVLCLCQKVVPTGMPRTLTQPRGATMAAAFTPFKHATLIILMFHSLYLSPHRIQAMAGHESFC
jgi:hypothetical protein